MKELNSNGVNGLTLEEKNIIEKLIFEIHIDFRGEDEVKVKTCGVLNELVNDIPLSS